MISNRSTRPMAETAKMIVANVDPREVWIAVSECEDEYTGFCIACGGMAWGVEPDAEDYRCDECGEMAVWGAEQIALVSGPNWLARGMEGGGE